MIKPHLVLLFQLPPPFLPWRVCLHWRHSSCYVQASPVEASWLGQGYPVEGSLPGQGYPVEGPGYLVEGSQQGQAGRGTGHSKSPQIGRQGTRDKVGDPFEDTTVNTHAVLISGPAVFMDRGDAMHPWVL